MKPIFYRWVSNLNLQFAKIKKKAALPYRQYRLSVHIYISLQRFAKAKAPKKEDFLRALFNIALVGHQGLEPWTNRL